MTLLILTADSSPARSSPKSCLPTASEPAVSLFPTSVPVSEADETPSGQPEAVSEGDETLSGQPEAISEGKVTRFSSFWKEEYPKGEVVGEVSLLYVFTYHPVTACHPSFPKEGSRNTPTYHIPGISGKSTAPDLKEGGWKTSPIKNKNQKS